MKKFGLTLLTAFIGGAMALGSYKLVEDKYASNMSFEDKQKVYLASNHYTPAAAGVSSAGQPDFVQAAAEVTPAVVFIRTTYSSEGADNQQSQSGEFQKHSFIHEQSSNCRQTATIEPV